jgi:hypothetical protein
MSDVRILLRSPSRATYIYDFASWGRITGLTAKDATVGRESTTTEKQRTEKQITEKEITEKLEQKI